MTIGVSLCAGTLAVELYQLCRQGPLTGFMGSKRRWAPELGAAVYGNTKPERLFVVDAGPWGDVWTTLADPIQRARVVERLLKLDAQGTLKDLWAELVAEAPSEDAARRVAQYLCVQSRVSNSLPVWWEPSKAEQPAAPLDVSTEGGLRHQPSQQPGRPSTPGAVQGNPPPDRSHRFRRGRSWSPRRATRRRPIAGQLPSTAAPQPRCPEGAKATLYRRRGTCPRVAQTRASRALAPRPRAAETAA